MKLRLLDILVCPYDKEWPLKVHIFGQQEIKDIKIPMQNEITKVVCRFYCAKKDIKLISEDKDGKVTLLEQAKEISYDNDCKDCLSQEINAGMIECSNCKSFYPIIDDIPMMLKTELRNEDIEKQFTEKWVDKIKEILPK